jgi:hypothetical protein
MRITRPLAADVTLAAVLTLAGIVGSTFAGTRTAGRPAWGDGALSPPCPA